MSGGVPVDDQTGQGKLEKKRSVTRRELKGKVGADGLQIVTQPEIDPRDTVIEELKADLDKLRKVCTCVICRELLFEPYFFQCGHVYCYGCIVLWIGQAKSKKQRFCPQCRVVIKSEPSPAFVVRDMIETFVARAEIMSPKGSGLEFRKQQKEVQQMLKRDKSACGLGIFRGIFSNEVMYGIRDPEDGVVRCPRCVWEVHNGRCQNPECGVRVREARDGVEMDSGESESDNLTEGGGEVPDRWPESALSGEDEWEDAIDDDDDDVYDDVDDVSDRRRGGQAIVFFNNPYSRDNNRRSYEDSEENIETESEGTVGSLADFVDDDSPQAPRRRPGVNGPWAPNASYEASSSPVRPVGAMRRQNARPIIIDDDDEEDDNQSSFSEASSRPTINTRRLARYQQARRVSLSDYEDDVQSLLSNGYQTLDNHDLTATEDDDDGFSSPPRAIGTRRNQIGRNYVASSVFSVPEEDGEDESADADDSESEDQDGDVRMSGSEQQQRAQRGSSAPTNSTTRQNRRPTNQTDRASTVELDSASESEVALSRRRQRRISSQALATRNNQFQGNQRNASGGAGGGQRNNRNNRNNRPTSVDPEIMSVFARHEQQLRDTAFDSLGRNPSSVSPARSITPVQRMMSGHGRRNSGGIIRGSTPLRGLLNSPPPQTFSPLQTPPPPMRQMMPSTIQATPSPAQVRHSNNPWSSPRSISLSPRLAGGYGQNWGALSQLQSPQRISSPMGGIRVRSRTSTNRLRGSGSRFSFRSNSATPVSSILSNSANTASAQARSVQQQQQQQPTQQQQQHQLRLHQQYSQPQQQLRQQHQHPQQHQPHLPSLQNRQAQQLPQQQNQPSPQSQQPPGQQGGPAAPRPGGSPRELPEEYIREIRARGELIRQQQLRVVSQGGTLRPQSEDAVGISRNGVQQQQSGAGAGNATDAVGRGGSGGSGSGGGGSGGHRVGVLIGGGSSDQRAGGPLLVIGNEDDTF